MPNAVIARSELSRESEVLEQAHRALARELSHLRLPLTCEYREGRLLLRGRVTSYYYKQIAQEAVLRLEPIERVVNQIEVVPE